MAILNLREGGWIGGAKWFPIKLKNSFLAYLGPKDYGTEYHQNKNSLI